MKDLSRIALEALAAQGYRDGKLSHSEVQREADLERDIEISQQIK